MTCQTKNVLTVNNNKLELRNKKAWIQRQANDPLNNTMLHFNTFYVSSAATATTEHQNSKDKLRYFLCFISFS